MYHPTRAAHVVTIVGLPLTGLMLSWVVVAGATMVIVGFALIRIARHLRYDESE